MAYKNHQDRKFDVVVFGATGFTGRLVAEYLATSYANDDFRWAMAGRNLEKLVAVRNEIQAPDDTPLIQADSTDRASLDRLCAQAKVVISTTGPYTLYGDSLVAACVSLGTDYVDLCGEDNFIYDSVQKYSDEAAKSGSRILFSCGFDSIPFDLGVKYTQNKAMAKFGEVCQVVRGRVTELNGQFSGGTIASIKAGVGVAMQSDENMRRALNPFALTPSGEGPRQPDGSKPMFEEDLDSWAAPFVMAAINTKNVHRTNALLGHPYGTDFGYSEMMLTGPGDSGKSLAEAMASDRSMMSDDAPKPGEGPSREARENGHYAVIFLGETASGKTITGKVSGDMDPGYGSTSKMLSESAICLIRGSQGTQTQGGIWTAAASIGDDLLAVLPKRAGVVFTLVD
ncbi:MAG: saccharopine dehydrogenase NADP-binding domain-containing protein [Pseudomonadota bacterium]